MWVPVSARVVFSIALASCTLAAQTGGPRVGITPRAVRARTATRSAANIRVDVQLTLIPVTVTDAIGAVHPGLNKEDFRLFEDGVEQEIRYFSADDAAVSMGLVFDASQSMAGKMEQSRAAVSRFFDTRIAGDEFFLMEFNDTPRLVCDFTSNTEEIEKTLVSIQPKNWTALFDAVYMSIRKMKNARSQRKALVILSDGGDNSSRYTESEMKSLVREADVSIYSIALVGGGLMRRHVGLLRSISEQTGGQVYEVEKIADLPDAVRKASAAIRHQYVLGYVSTNGANDGLYRRTEVRLNAKPDQPKLRATWKNGYYASE